MSKEVWGKHTHTDEMWWKVRFLLLVPLCQLLVVVKFLWVVLFCFSSFVLHLMIFLRLFTCNKLITALATLIFSLLYKCETDDSWVFLLNLFRLMMFLLSFFVLLACKSLGFETSLWFYRSFRFLLNFRFSSIRHLLVTRMFPLLMLLFVFVWLI